MPVVSGRIGRFWANKLGAYDETSAVINRIRVQREIPGAETEAQIVFGRESQFQVLEPSQTGAGLTLNRDEGPDCTDSRFQIGWGTDKCEPQLPVLQYNEVQREEEIVRVENPDDPDQYVEVARILSVVFRGPNGRMHQFHYTHPTVGG